MSDSLRVALLVVNLASAAVMVGVIWFVQVVHYPLLARFSEAVPATVAQEHQRRTGWVVGAPLAVEGFVALALLAWPPDAASTADTVALWAAAAVLGVALLSTVAIQVPQHGRLAVGHDAEVARRLVTGNWIRTVAWSVRLVLLIAVTARVAGA